MFQRAGRYAVVESSLHVSVQQAVNHAGRERIAGSQTIHDFDLVSPRAKDGVVPIRDAGPAVSPYERIVAESEGHHLQRKAFGDLGDHLFVIVTLNFEYALDIF